MAIDFPNSPTNGQTFTVGDTVWTYDGTKWNKNAVTLVGPTGPISLVVQPGTPSTTNVLWLDSDATTTNNSILTSTVDAKGDLIIGTADNTVGRLAAGSNGDVLIADSGATEGLRWQGQSNTGRNLVINGAMQIAQRGSSVTGITGVGYNTADRWGVSISSLGTWTQTVENDGPTGSGLAKSLKMLCTTADASPSSSDALIVETKLEGQDLQRVLKGTSAAKQITLSFWVKTNVTGTYVVEMNDQSNSRSVSRSYTVNASGTWEYETLTFPADTTGAFANSNAAALIVQFWMGAGSNFTSGSLQTTWSTQVNANRAVGVVNLGSATNNYWQITGVQLEVGSVATGFDFEPYETTLRKCQRYYWRYGGDDLYQAFGEGWYESTTSGTAYITNPVPMRVKPSSVEFSTLATWDGTIRSISAITLNRPAVNINNILVTVSGATANRPLNILANNSTSAYLAMSAEL